MSYYLIHCPKTGGSSLKYYFKKHRIYLGGGKGFGHQPFEDLKIPETAITIAPLRCPIQHTISLYRYHGGHKKHEMYTPEWWCYNQSFSDWIRNPKGLRGQPVYHSFFGPQDFYDYEKTLQNLRSITYILDTKHLTEQFNRLVAQPRHFPPFKAHVNKTEGPEVNLIKDDVEYLRELRRKDFEICKEFNIEITDVF